MYLSFVSDAALGLWFLGRRDDAIRFGSLYIQHHRAWFHLRKNIYIQICHITRRPNTRGFHLRNMCG